MIYVLFGLGCALSFYLGARYGFNYAIEEMTKISLMMSQLPKEDLIKMIDRAKNENNTG